MTAYICNKPIAIVYTNSDEKYAAGQATLGELFVKIGETNALYQVRVWGIDGWISKENVDETALNASCFDQAIMSLNAVVYEASNVHSKHLSMLYCGTKIHVLKQEENWCHIEAYGIKGWIFSYHLIDSNFAQFLETRMVPGNNSMEGIDNLGLVHLYLKARGIEAPKSQKLISEMGADVKIDELKAGDILIFGQKDHLGIYEGEGKFIHTDMKEVVRDHLSDWKMSLVSARRFIN